MYNFLYLKFKQFLLQNPSYFFCNFPVQHQCSSAGVTVNSRTLYAFLSTSELLLRCTLPLHYSLAMKCSRGHPWSGLWRKGLLAPHSSRVYGLLLTAICHFV